MTIRSIARLLMATAFLACGRPESAAPDDSATPRDSAGAIPRSSTAPDSVALRLMYEEVRALAKADGCAQTAQCRVAPVGVRGCGGPSEFVVYCPMSTDTARLARRIAALDSAEAAYNAKYQVASTCEMRMAPAIVADGGSCRAEPRP